MACRISVVIRTGRGDSWLTDLVSSLDAQSLPYAEFEVLFVLAGPDATTRDRVTELCARRPNMYLVDQPVSDAALMQRATGNWVLDLGSSLESRRPTLFNRALQSLVDFGEVHRCDIVLGRVIARNLWHANDLFVGDRPRIETRLFGSGEAHAAVVRRRAADLAGGNAAPVVGVLGSYPSVLVTSGTAPESAGSVLVERQRTAWDNATIVVTAEGSVTAERSAGRVVFGLRHVGTGIEYWLPSHGSCVDSAFSGTARMDLRDPSVREWLIPGVWQASVGVHGEGTDWSPRGPLSASLPCAGIIDGLLVGRAQHAGRQCLDIGARRSSVVGRLDRGSVTIAESAQGTSLSVSLDSIVAIGSCRVAGELLLGGFPLRAHLVVEDDRARLEAALSGLTGSSELSTRFGRARSTPTGLTLDISPVGGMTVRRTPPASPAQPPSAQTHRAGGAADEQIALVRRLRKATPAALEPAIRALSRSGTARRVYRFLGRSSAGRH